MELSITFKILVRNFYDTPQHIPRHMELGKATSPPSRVTPLQKYLADILEVNIEEISPQVGAKFIYGNHSSMKHGENRIRNSKAPCTSTTTENA